MHKLHLHDLLDFINILDLLDLLDLLENILSPPISSNNFFVADRPNFQVMAWVNFGSTALKAIASNSVHQHTYIPIASSDI